MNWMVLGSLLACLGVALGAFGAHGLRPRVSPRDLEIFETAVRYQLLHALALIVTGIIGRQLQEAGRLLAAVPWLFTVGILLFSGSLYLMVLLDKRWLGAITPLGGLLFLAGWLVLANALWHR